MCFGLFVKSLAHILGLVNGQWDSCAAVTSLATVPLATYKSLATKSLRLCATDQAQSLQLVCCGLPHSPQTQLLIQFLYYGPLTVVYTANYLQ